MPGPNDPFNTRCTPTLLLPPQTLALQKSLQVINAPTTCVSFLQRSHALAVGSLSRVIRLYDATTYEQCGAITGVEETPLVMAAWLQVEKMHATVDVLALGDSGGYVRIYDVRSKEKVRGREGDRVTG